MKYRFKDRQKVWFDNGLIKGEGLVVGVATMENFIIGSTYMVEVLTCNVPFPKESYPFKTIPVIDLHLEEIE
jgi:hypothetical protein